MCEHEQPRMKHTGTPTARPTNKTDKDKRHMSVATHAVTLQHLETLKNVPADVLDALAIEGDTILLDKGTFKRNQVLPDMPGGWKLQLITKPPRANSAVDEEVEGRVILFYNDKRTKAIWIPGQAVMAQKAGLSKEHAEIWVRSRVSYKHDNLPRLVRIMRNPKQVEAYTKWPSSRETADREAWAKEFNIRDQMPPRQREQLSQLVNELVRGKDEPAPQNMVLSNALLAAMRKHDEKKAIEGNVADPADTATDEELDVVNGNLASAEESVADEEHADELIEEIVATGEPAVGTTVEAEAPVAQS